MCSANQSSETPGTALGYVCLTVLAFLYSFLYSFFCGGFRFRGWVPVVFVVGVPHFCNGYELPRNEIGRGSQVRLGSSREQGVDGGGRGVYRKGGV